MAEYAQGVPRPYILPESGQTPQGVAHIIQDALSIDIIPANNLAAFHTTYMEPEIEEIMSKQMAKNITHVEAYPGANDIERQCLNMIARLFHAPLPSASAEAVGVSTIGSSEAIILAVLAAKRHWCDSRKKAGKAVDRPNIVMHSNVHVCWKKAAFYLDVEERYCGSTANSFVLDPHEAVSLVDEHTILVAAILGSTYTGDYEDVKALNDLLLQKNQTEGLSVHIHVDAASGGFVAPFAAPNLAWDFRLPLVCSINVSSHKYGLTYAAVGWAVWRSEEYLPKELVFKVGYCGSTPMMSFTVNFSKNAIQIIAQYYQLLRLGRQGYQRVIAGLLETKDYLAQSLQSMGNGQLFSVISKLGNKGLPIVVWKLKTPSSHNEYDIAASLRLRGWLVPAYTMTVGEDKMILLRVVVRQDFTRPQCELFLSHLHLIDPNSVVQEAFRANLPVDK